MSAILIPTPAFRGHSVGSRTRRVGLAILALLMSPLAPVGLTLCLVRPASAAQEPPRSLREVVIVFKTHFDIGYTDMASNVVNRYRTTMIDDALQVVEANRDLPREQQFAWTLSGWPLTQIVKDGPGQTAERQRRVRAALQQGRLVTHALPFTTHTETLQPEDLVRGLGFASHLSRDAGLPLPRDAKMTDVPSHAWILPTLLRQAGVDFLHLGCNAASRSPVLPPLFFWEGPDGSRLLTLYTAESYGTGLVPPADWPYATWLALIHTGDNHGPPRPDEVKAVLQDASTRLPGVRVRIGRLSDFADALLAEKAPVPVVRGDMPDTWIHGPMSDPQGAGLARRTRSEMLSLELLNSSMEAWGMPAADLGAPMAKAYEQSLLYGEHTWGGAYWWIYGNYQAHYGDRWKAERAAGRFARIESSWAEHTAYIETARQMTAPLLEERLGVAARSVNVAGPRLVVFNPLPWRRSGRVELRGRPADPGFWRPADGHGESTPVSSDSDGTISLAVRDIPPGGYRTFVPAEPRAMTPAVSFDATTATIESPFFRAALDTNQMVLTSLIERATGREWVRPAGPAGGAGLGQFVYERFSADEVAAFVKAYVKIDTDWATNELGKPMLPPAAEAPYRRHSPTGFVIRVEQSVDRLCVLGSTPRAVGLRGTFTVGFIFYADRPAVDVVMSLDKPAEPWPEAGWMALPFQVEKPRFRMSRPGSIVDPSTDIVAGANRHLFALDGGLVVTDPNGAGIGVCALDSPLVSLGSPGCWKYSKDDFPREPTVYVNLFNNQWTTNFRLWNEGSWTTRVRLWAVSAGADVEAALVTPSLEARYPLLGSLADGPTGDRPPTARGLEVSSPGVLITAFGANPDGPGTLLRVWELSGRTATCRLTLPEGSRLERLQTVDLRGRRLNESSRLVDGVLSMPLRGFAPSSVVLEP